MQKKQDETCKLSVMMCEKKPCGFWRSGSIGLRESPGQGSVAFFPPLGVFEGKKRHIAHRIETAMAHLKRAIQGTAQAISPLSVLSGHSCSNGRRKIQFGDLTWLKDRAESRRAIGVQRLIGLGDRHRYSTRQVIKKSCGVAVLRNDRPAWQPRQADRPDPPPHQKRGRAVGLQLVDRNPKCAQRRAVV